MSCGEIMENKLLKLAICDDEKSSLTLIASAVESAFLQHGIQTVIHQFSNLHDLKLRLESGEYDLLLLDIRIGETDGIDFAVTLRNQNNHTEIIFISNCEERAFDAFAVKPFGFIRKGKFLSDVTEIIDAFVHNSYQENVKTISLKVGDKLVSIALDDIIYIESCKHEQSIKLTNGKELTLHSKMQRLEAQLAEMGFLRVHIGYIVNMQYIRLIEPTTLSLTNGEKIPISRKNTAEIKKKYLEYKLSHGNAIL